MTENLRRHFADLTLRADGTGRTISGVVVPFGRTARVTDGGPFYSEQFRLGAFTKTIKERGDRVKLLYQHDSSNPIGRATMLREDPVGLIGDFHVTEGVAKGDEVLSLVRDGVIDSFSVGFSGVKHVREDNVVVRTEVALREASAVTFPAYEDAAITEVRAMADRLGVDIDGMSAAEALARLAGAPDLTTATTADGQPGREHGTHEPASATRDVMSTFRSLRALARERGII